MTSNFRGWNSSLRRRSSTFKLLSSSGTPHPNTDDPKCAGLFATRVLVIAKPLRVDEERLAHESSMDVRLQFVNDARVPARLNNLAEPQTLHRRRRLTASAAQLHFEGPPIFAEVVRQPNDPFRDEYCHEGRCQRQRQPPCESAPLGAGDLARVWQ